MTLFDLISLSLKNLLRRKTRTLLTVLGVVIGTASIVVMMSIGIGMKRQMTQMYASYGSLTTITVNSFRSDGSTEDLTDAVIEKFKRLPHVSGVSPKLSVGLSAKSGAAEGYISLSGVSQEFLQQIPLKSGSCPGPDEPTLSVIYGNMIGENFYLPSKSGSFWSGETALVDPEKDTIFFTFPRGYVKPSSPAAGAETAEPPQKKYLLDVAGIVDGGSTGYTQYSFEAYCDIDSFKTFLRRLYRKNLVPEPKTNKKGRPLGYYVYDEAYIFVDDMKQVSAVQQMISDLGFQADSQMQWLEQSQKSMRMTQAVLGGIGAVSLLVAAIGIINTMMMSIYERTREIGVMKVLGCDMTDIRNMFLVESGAIGFIGGVIGLLVSLLISRLINILAPQMSADGMGMFYMSAEGGDISYIPPWLFVFSLLFAVAIGTAAGYLPSKRAMRLSPLAALRNE
ncbi:MAG: ABC transporter permease [Stomatobaculum sp.]